MLWELIEKGGTLGSHTAPAQITWHPQILFASPADSCGVEGVLKCQPKWTSPQPVLPPWEVPSCLRPAGAELKLVTCASLAPRSWIPPTHPQNLPAGTSEARGEDRQMLSLSLSCSLAFSMRQPSLSWPLTVELETPISGGWSDSGHCCPSVQETMG